MPVFGDQQVIGLTIQEARSTYASSVNSQWPAGTLGVTQDGRWFRFARAGASTLVPGNVLAGPAPVTNHVGNTAVATAAGLNTVTFTQGGTAITQNQYKDGWLVVSVTPGAGFTYGISDHAAVGSAASNAYPLAPGESVQVALTTTSRLDLISNPYRGVIQAPITTLTSNPVGVAVSAPTTGQWCWIQVQGVCGVLTSGTLIIGENAISPAGAAGAVGPNSSGGSETEVVIGQVVRVAATTAWSSIDLKLLS